MVRGVHVKYSSIHNIHSTLLLKAASLTKCCLSHLSFPPSCVSPHAQPALRGRREPVQSEQKQGSILPTSSPAPSLTGRVHLPGERAEGHRPLQLSRGTEKESKCHPLGKTHGSHSASPHQHSGWDWEFHWDHRIFYPSTQNEKHICLNWSFGSHVPRMSTNFLSREWTYSGTNWFHGIHFFCVESKWKSYKVGRWPVIKSGQFCFDRGHGNTKSALAHAWNELMLFVPWIAT